ncbi:MAG: leucyl-tRNA synthetase [Cyclobacteriaceae bacterium]|jgi:leucyl-tRNA synthetase
MGQYNHSEIESKWQKKWESDQTYKVEIDHSRPKYYVLDMFPYPSGAGLHVGHPLGYIATDIISRYKRLKGFNVLHPMGFDSFGLPAEQYAIQTGQHPAITTEQNITRYKEQLRNLGFSFDWSREVRTSSSDYYKWTQWIFKLLFSSWYNRATDKAEKVDTLISAFEEDGNQSVEAHSDDNIATFSAEDWNSWSEERQQKILLKYRITYIADTTVNWCPELGTVLSNDEVKDGFSERGGHPVVKKTLPQWNMRITAYADRLINDLETLDWPDSIKEMQRNWIGKSIGAELDFQIENSEKSIRVFTTRMDTIYGVTFLVLAPESALVPELTTKDQQTKIAEYVEMAKNRSERDRMSDVKHISGEFTGSYVTHPFSGERVPIWIADYVLAGYGTGAVMAVPSGDQRDFDFAKHFDLPIIKIIDSQKVTDTEADATKTGKMINSGFLDGLSPVAAINKAIEVAEEKGIGTKKVNYKIRDAVYGRQRYWGEPFPIYYKNGLPYLLEDDQLPLSLPDVDKFLPTEDGEPPLARAENWAPKNGDAYETTTMPGWAGSSWYFFRYMDPHNEKEFAGAESLKYWKEVDFYMGGSEHATGHLLYSRFWTKFLYDLGIIEVKEYAKKLVNQGMIQGISSFIQLQSCLSTDEQGVVQEDCEERLVYMSPVKEGHFEINGKKYKASTLVYKESRIDSAYVDDEGRLFYSEFQKLLQDQRFDPALKGIEDVWWEKDSNGEQFIKVRRETEKMSKSKYNVVNPDDLVIKYGADTLRMYEMFLGPIEQSKPWNTNGIEGVSKFLKRFWALFFKNDAINISTEKPSKAEYKVLHTLIKKIEEDIERLSLNTSVSNFMIATNELSSLKCNKNSVLEPLVILLAPYAPHLAEELWHALGNETTVFDESYPIFEAKYLVEDSKEYPIMINGKMRAKISFASDVPQEQMKTMVLQNELVQKWLDGKDPKKIIVVPNKIINVVI